MSNAKAARCSSVLGRVTLPLLGVPILDGSRSACRWDNDPDALQPGTFGPSHLPSLSRHDYVTNSNDSYWLSNPKRPLTRVRPDHRRRADAARAADAARPADGRAAQAARFRRSRQVMDTVFNNRQYAGELFRDPLVGLCRQSPVRVGTRGPVNVSEACPVLEQWNLQDDLDSRGAVLFRRFAQKLLALPGPLGAVPVTPPGVYGDAFDPDDAVNTPRGLNTGNPLVAPRSPTPSTSCATTASRSTRGCASTSTEPRGSERIPIHGGPGASASSTRSARRSGGAGLPRRERTARAS